MEQELSSDLRSIDRAYDVVVVGSGYGGAITAARLAEAGRRVCVLERGREWRIGEFPDELSEVAQQIRTDDNPLGLYDFTVGDDIDVVVGNGLGGTSLINANVVIEPDNAIFAGPRWPASVRAAVKSGELADYGRRFIGMIRPTNAGPPGGWPTKVQAMERSAARTNGELVRLNVAVNMREFDGVPNHVGVVQHLCKQCGDCVTGCNVGAKNTLMMNYLPYAHARGAQIYTQTEVQFVTPVTGGYAVWFRAHGDPAPRVVTATVVVLAAGSLGSTGILLRSAERGLPTSWRLGHHFSGNADQLGIGYNNDTRADSLGFGAYEDSDTAVGPTILSAIRYPDDGGGRPFLIEDGAFPRAFVSALRGFGGVLEAFDGEDTDRGVRDKLGELTRVARDWIGKDPKGAANHSMVYLGIGHDGADGQLRLDSEGRVKVCDDGAPQLPVFETISQRMYECVEALGGTYVKNPRWTRVLGGNLITVHPLGGCPMGDDIDHGAVNGYGEVWNPDGGVHRGLFVADGSVLPDAVGVNPLYTISALAERTAEHIAKRDDLRHEPPSAQPPAPSAPTIGLEFSETMRGFVTANTTDAATPAAFRDAYERGKTESNHVAFKLTMLVSDVDRFIDDAKHQARTEGVIESLSYGKCRRVDRGRFNLYVADGPGVRRMEYVLQFTAEDGAPYVLDGFKVIRDDAGIDVWADNTTLFTSIRKGTVDGPIVAQGILHIGVFATLKLLTTIKVRNSPSPGRSARVIARFGRFAFGSLWATHVAPKLREVE